MAGPLEDGALELLPAVALLPDTALLPLAGKELELPEETVALLDTNNDDAEDARDEDEDARELEPAPEDTTPEEEDEEDDDDEEEDEESPPLLVHATRVARSPAERKRAAVCK